MGQIVYCAICRGDTPLRFRREPLADLKIYKCGELDSILVAHRACAEANGGREAGWGWDEPAPLQSAVAA